MNRRAAWTLGVALLASLPAISLSGCSSTRTADIEYRDNGDYRFSRQPRMARVGDTDVYYIRDASDYDVYEFAGTWYLNDGGNWFRAGSWRGPFVSINADVIPYDIATVPSDYRRNWVGVNRNYRNRDLPRGYWASGRTFSARPAMGTIPNSAVTYARRASDFDLYRLHGTWYLVDNGVWYRSTSWRGPFLTIRYSIVPGEILAIPSSYRREWSAPASYRDDEDRDYDRNRDNRGSEYEQRRDDDRYATVRYWSSGRTFTTEPQTYVIGNTGVDYYRGDEGYDIYRYGSTWYLVDNGGWYRADTWRGPFISVQVGGVPRAILTVPSGYRRYGTTD